MRQRQLVTLLALCFFVVATIHLLRSPSTGIADLGSGYSFPHEEDSTLSPLTATSHPLRQLISEAGAQQNAILKKQSATLQDAVKEYKRRYKLPPPPNFDKWFDFAREHEVQLIDEYDTIHHSLLPFWGLPPAVIRERAREALGFDNALMGLLIRNGKVAKIAGADEWQQEATKGMLKDFASWLPDMDLAFNRHDEPRVVVPHEDLARLLEMAASALTSALANPFPTNAWSSRPSDVGDGRRFADIRTTRFNRFAHQPTWTHSRMSCPADAPSRSLLDSTADDSEAFSFSTLRFINNKTAFSDVCLSPSLRGTHGFFDRPNAFDIVHDLFPVFSQSKMSSFQDILYPSPWYWADKVPYHQIQDYAWTDKVPKLFWRGSTTGGFSRDGGWRRQHRQGIVRTMNGLDKAQILVNSTAEDASLEWFEVEVPRPEYKDLFDVSFSHVGQCDPGDCSAQREFFRIAKEVPQHQAWKYKYLLDMDGNAFSGRFYAFLRSYSLPVKMAVFREWHDEWIKPWVHYVPLSLEGKEYVETIRYLDRENDGRILAAQMAEEGRQWAGKVLRKKDLEAWFFRLLLEYGRLVDDDREHIGFETTS